MDSEAFKKAYYAIGRNGVNRFMLNPLYPRLHYSDGMQECAAAGIYWFLDIIGTELVPAMLKAKEPMLLSLYIKARESKAEITAVHPVTGVFFARDIMYTDMEKGTWSFLISQDGDQVVRLILPTEY